MGRSSRSPSRDRDRSPKRESSAERKERKKKEKKEREMEKQREMEKENAKQAAIAAERERLSAQIQNETEKRQALQNNSADNQMQPRETRTVTLHNKAPASSTVVRPSHEEEPKDPKDAVVHDFGLGWPRVTMGEKDSDLIKSMAFSNVQKRIEDDMYQDYLKQKAVESRMIIPRKKGQDTSMERVSNLHKPAVLSLDQYRKRKSAHSISDNGSDASIPPKEKRMNLADQKVSLDDDDIQFPGFFLGATEDIEQHREQSFQSVETESQEEEFVYDADGNPMRMVEGKLEYVPPEELDDWDYVEEVEEQPESQFKVQGDSPFDFELEIKQYHDKIKHCDEKVGPAVGPSISNFLTDVFRKKTKEKPEIEKKIADIPRPVNIEGLRQIRCDEGVWQGIKDDTRISEQHLQKIHACILKGACGIASVLEIVREVSENPDKNVQSILVNKMKGHEMIKTLFKAAEVLGFGSQFLVTKRRAMIKKDLNPKFQRICSENHEFNENLFGGNLEEVSKDITNISRITEKYTPRNNRGRGRRGRGYWVPRGRGGRSGYYKQGGTKNWSGPRWTPRGRGGFSSRGRGRGGNHQNQSSTPKKN